VQEIPLRDEDDRVGFGKRFDRFTDAVEQIDGAASISRPQPMIVRTSSAVILPPVSSMAVSIIDSTKPFTP
jgi:hypothetical protein